MWDRKTVQRVIDKRKVMKNNINRRKFFGLAGMAAIGTSLFANTPLKFFDRSKRIRLNKKVKIHPSAVKRTK